MSILIGRDTRLVVQGITGREGEFHSRAGWRVIAVAALLRLGVLPIGFLLLAVLLYAAAHWIGVDEPKAVVSAPAAGNVPMVATISLMESASGRSGLRDLSPGLPSYHQNLSNLITSGSHLNRNDCPLHFSR